MTQIDQLICGIHSLHYAQKIASSLHIPCEPNLAPVYPNQECRVQFRSPLTHKNVGIVQLFSPQIHNNLIELFLMLEVASLAQVNSITLIVPYLCYLRENPSKSLQISYSPNWLAKCLAQYPIANLYTLDPHIPSIDQLFPFPVHTIPSSELWFRSVQDKLSKPLVIVAPDRGSHPKAHQLSQSLGLRTLYLDKRNLSPLGLDSFPTYLIVDDMVDTGRTLSLVSHYLNRSGAKNIMACVTHAVFSGMALETIQKSPLKKLFITNSITQNALPTWIEQVETEPMIIRKIIEIG